MLTPDQVKLLAIVSVAAALFAGGATSGWVLNGWRLGKELEHAQRERDTHFQQSQVLSAGLRACNAGVDEAKRIGDLAVGQVRAHLLELKKLDSGSQAAVDRIEDLLRKPPPSGAGCEKAWDAIEAERKARAP